MSGLLSVVLSSLDVVITVIHFIVSVWWLHHKYTRKYESTADTTSNRTLWLQMGICLVLAILGILLLVFSIFPSDDNALKVLLSLIGAILIVCQGGMLSRIYDAYVELLQWPLWGSLFLYFVSIAILSALIAKRIASKTICHILETVLLSLFVVGYFLISSIYLRIFWRGRYMDSSYERTLVRRVVICNTCLCIIALISTLFSFSIYLGGKVDFITSLWIENSAATAWGVWVLVTQLSSLRKARLSIRSNITQRPTPVQLASSSLHSTLSLNGSSQKCWDEELGVQSGRQNSMTVLVKPSPIHVREQG